MVESSHTNAVLDRQLELSQTNKELLAVVGPVPESTPNCEGYWIDGVSLVIPAYNEEARIERALDAYVPVLEKLGKPFEVIVVMDGNDGTPQIVDKFANRHVTGYHAQEKLGKGGALISGFTLAKFGVVGYVDADGSLRSEDLSKLIQETTRYPCVIASRWTDGSRWLHREPFSKRVAGRGFNFLVRGLLGVPVKDSQCGAKFYRAPLLRRIMKEVTITNLTIDVGFLCHVRKAGERIKEVPVSWDHHEGSRFKLGRMVVYMFVTVLGLRIMNLKISRLVPVSLITLFRDKLGNV